LPGDRPCEFHRPVLSGPVFNPSFNASFNNASLGWQREHSESECNIMKLNEIRDNQGARKGRVRVGRGIGSGVGKTAGRGQKGQKSRSGVSIKGFEGGQMPLHMRLPKRGFNNPFGKDYAEVNLGQLQKLVEAGKLDISAVIDHAALQAAGVARGGKDGVRLLGKGAITAKIKLKVAGASAAAKAAVEAAGGAVDVIHVVPAGEKAAAKKGVSRAARLAKKG
jgi:large subunit ribosomal protein L15